MGLRVLDKHPTDLGLRRRLAESATRLAVARADAGDSEGSLADFERAYRIARDITPNDIADSQTFYVRSMVASNLSGAYHRTDRHEDAAAIQDEALRFTRDVRVRRPEDPVVAAQLIEHLCFVATERNDLEKPEEASPLLDEAESIIETLANLGPTSPGRDLTTLRKWVEQERGRLAVPSEAP